MTSLKRWRQIGQGQFRKWETPSQELEGSWQGQHDGLYGPLGALETAEGRILPSLSTPPCWSASSSCAREPRC